MWTSGSWGGISVMGYDNGKYVWFMQKSQYNDSNFIFAMKVSDNQWNKCKVHINNGTITIYLNDNQVGQITPSSISQPFHDGHGSSTNPCYLRELRFIELP
jgi:hypothetical protein